MSARPLLLLDIDGVVFPLAEQPGGDIPVPDGYRTAQAGSFPVSYHPQLPAFLEQAGGLAQIAWCTSWLEDANTLAGPILDLPTLDVLDPRGGHQAVEAYAAGRPLVWCDDQRLTSTVRAWRARRPEPTLLVAPKRHVGLTGRQMARILTWLEAA